MTNDDLIFRHRQQLFARAAQVGVRRACRELGFHHSTYYHWKPLVERHGLEILRPRERRAPRMPNQIPPWLAQKIIAAALGEPGLGPRRLAAQLEHSLGERVSPGGLANVLWWTSASTGRRYACAYNHHTQEIEIRDRTVQGGVLHQFSNATPITSVETIFSTL